MIVLSTKHPEMQIPCYQPLDTASCIIDVSHTSLPAVPPPCKNARSPFRQITVEDPVEVVHARNVAIAQIVVALAATYICLTPWCAITFLITVIPSSLVACCCKFRAIYLIWSLIGVLLVVMNVFTAFDAKESLIYYFRDPKILYVVQAIQCFVSALAAYCGCKTVLALRNGTVLLDRV